MLESIKCLDYRYISNYILISIFTVMNDDDDDEFTYASIIVQILCFKLSSYYCVA